MSELMIVFVIGAVVAFVVFAIIGFVHCLIWLFGSSEKRVAPVGSSTGESVDVAPSFEDDLAASGRMIQHLCQTGQIDERTFEKLRDFLDTHVTQDSEPTPLSGSADPQSGIAAAVEREVSSELAPKTVELSAVPAANEEVLMAIAVTDDQVTPSEVLGAEAGHSPSKPAPWDMPDPPAAPPRRSLGELMSGFMEEKNMRWGELTSGILIVLSAVGLVVSLREELRNTIPYFSALLFMLITAAIHGAGIYTFKKWKLRNTSRGTLVIGLLLVPLNFVAASILSGGEERRALTDPWLWAAVTLGIVGFTAMTWWSSKCLLRRGQWPMVAAIMGCGIGTLLVNRLVEPGQLSLLLLGIALPIGASFMVGTSLFDRRQWVRERWTERAVNRMFLFLGISAFACLAGGFLVVVRSGSVWSGVVALTPIMSIVCLMTAWLGAVAKRGVVGKSAVSLRLAGQSLEVLGLISMAISWVVSVSNPTIFSVNALVSVVGLVAMFLHQKNEKMLPVAWAVLAAGVLAGVNLALGNFAIDQWYTLVQWRDALLSGRSGLCLLAVGCGVVGIHLALGRRFVADANRKLYDTIGWTTGGVIVLAGCLIAVAASFADRDNIFDAMTASGLLSVAAIGSLVACVVAGRKEIFSMMPQLPHVAPVLLLGALAHALIWNRVIGDGFDSLTGETGLGWITVAAGVGWVTAVLAWLTIRAGKRLDGENVRSNWDAGGVFAGWSGVASAIVSVGVFFLIERHTGWATIYMMAASVSFWLMGLALIQSQRFQLKDPLAVPFVFSTGLLGVVAIADLGVRLSWCPGVETPTHWLIQAIGLAGWSVAWSVASVVFGRIDRCRWLTASELRIDQVVLGGVVIALGGLIGLSLVGGVGRELYVDFNFAGISLAGPPMSWAFTALGASGVALVISIVERPTPWKGAGVVLVWMLVWAFGATPFESSLSVGSALRWLLPMGGIVLAVLVAFRRPWMPVWVSGRNRMSLSGPSRWSNESTQGIINFSLALVTAVVLLISTITTSQVLLNGVASLGGPEMGSWFRRISPEISFGMPIAIIVGTFLIYAISERRRWLAMAGSAVFQYVVVMAIVLLFASPHAKLASSWFLSILQAVSLGMTGYGFAWLWMQGRIDGEGGEDGIEKGGMERTFWGRLSAGRKNSISPIEIHTLVNGLLITSLAVLVMGRFYFMPDQSSGWIGSVGSPMGILAWASFGLLALGVGWHRLSQTGSVLTWSWLSGWMGLNLVGLIAAVVDQRTGSDAAFVPWLAFNVVTVGVTMVVFGQVCLIGWFGPGSNPNRLGRWISRMGGKHDPVNDEGNGSPANAQAVSVGGWGAEQMSVLALPMLVTSGIGMLFAARGAWMNSGSFGIYLGVIVILSILIAMVGAFLRSAILGFVAIVVAGIGVAALRMVDPLSWFSKTEPYGLNLMTVAMALLAFGWTLFYLDQRRRKRGLIRRSFVLMPNCVVLAGAIWVFVAAVLQLLCDSSGSANVSTLMNPLGIAAWLSVVGLWVAMIWNDRARFRVVTGCLLSLAIVIGLISRLAGSETWRWVGVNFGVAMLVGWWGWLWLQRSHVFKTAKGWGVTRLVALERTLGRQLPVGSVIVAVLTLAMAAVAIVVVEDRAARYLAAAIPFALAFAFGCQSNGTGRRWMQILCLSLMTLGGLFLAWTDMSQGQILADSMLHPGVRSLIVLAGAMFVYGGLVTRWVRPGDTWIRTFREMAVATSGLAVVCLAWVVFAEAVVFEPGIGCGLAVGESVTVTILVLGMIVGLIILAVRPENDPFALSLRGRMGYVYVAQFVSAALVAHLYFSMPYLFRFGIQEYWPFIAMALCFGGVGVARVLENRRLTVLAQPLFHVASILPVMVAAGIFTIGSSADTALVILVVGMAYLMISYTHRSMLSGIGAIVFGNLALWIFFHRYPGFSFFRHPQWWVIPPAVSVLIAGQLNRASLSAAQLAAIRYVCVAIIYVGSTSEIFIDGVGDRLWPPVALAVLAVIGILSGIMMQIKSFLYFGSLFLLLAMTTMVAHAHQRLDHVWPWWAFGIGLGVAILVMFGVFEKRKKEMKRIASRMKDWEA